MKRKRILAFESLEGREVPATFGIPWHDPSRLSISFAPDGTRLAGHESRLVEALDGLGESSDWRRTVLQAFQTWAAHANLDFGWRADGGQDFGAPGLTQGDPRFGDIRIGAHDMTPEVLAVSVPPDPALSGTWSGDVLLNSSYAFGTEGLSLQAVALHEAGNALGLADVDDPDAVMYRFYNAARTGLSPADIAALRALYGPRRPDIHEGPNGNGSLLNASPLPEPAGYAGETPLVAFGDVTTAGDVDFYEFTFPAVNDDATDLGLTVRLQSEGVSLLAPDLTVFGPSGRVLARQTSTSITGDVLQIQLNQLRGGETYRIRVRSATRDVFGVGRYGLSVRPDKTSSTSDDVIHQLLAGPFRGLGPEAVDAFFRNSGDVLLNPDPLANETPATATPLVPNASTGNGIRFEAIGSIASREDVDVYELIAPRGTARVLQATVWTPAAETGFQPRITLVDAAGRRLPAEVLVNGNGTSTIQVPATRAGQRYFLKVENSPGAGEDKGNYLLGVQFGRTATTLQTFSDGTLDQADRVDESRLYISRTQLFHFVLSTGLEDEGASIRLTVKDEAGNEVQSFVATAGGDASGGSVLLRPGAYDIQLAVDNPNGRPLSYRLRGGRQSDPIGPVPTDSTMAPLYTSTLNPGVQIYPGVAVPYDPTRIPGIVFPGNPATYPPGFRLPPQYANHPWLVVSTDPYYWIRRDF